MPTELAGTAGLRWQPLNLDPAFAGEELTLSPQLRALIDAGVPLPLDGAGTAKDHALSLLKAAAEVEHALMVQYLYLALSVSDAAISRDIVQVAIEEMAHLGTVQNLLLLLGGPVELHMQRDVVRQGSGQNPLPFVLEPLSMESLAKYAVVEAPATPPAELRAKFEELRLIAQDSAGVTLNRVGAIYALLEWIFTDAEEADSLIDLQALLPPGSLPDQPHLTDADLQLPEICAAHEMLPAEWGDDSEDYLLETVRTRAGAVLAIRAVGAQGEGAEAGADSHFLHFMDLVARFEAGGIPTLALPRSPQTQGHGGERPTPLTRGYTIKWARAFNAQYIFIVLGIHHATRLSRSVPEQVAVRQPLAQLTMRGMRAVLLRVARLVTTLPATEGEDAIAGPPFELDPALLPSDLGALPELQRRLLAEAESLYQSIETDPAFVADGDEATALRAMRQLDLRRQTLFASA